MKEPKKWKKLVIIGIIAIIFVFLICLILFKTTFINKEEVKSIVVDYMDISSSDAKLWDIEFDYESDTWLYEVEVTYQNNEYEFTIDARTGEIYKTDYYQNKADETNTSDNNNNQETTTSSESSGKTLEEAKNIALNDSNLTTSEVSFIKTELDTDNNQKIYEIEFTKDNTKYDYEIRYSDGSIIGLSVEIINYTKVSSTSTITETEAKEIALEHANLNINEVTFKTVKKDYEDTIAIYEIEFYKDNIEYDYEIEISSGIIIKYSYEVK